MGVTFAGQSTIVVVIEEASQVGHARRTAQNLAVSAGFDATDAGRVALVVTELATNVLKHARSGAIHLGLAPGVGTLGVEVIAVDRGPGFNLADCLPDGVSTGGTRGEGLGAVSRQADVFDMYADARGAIVLARFYPKGFGKADIRFGASQHALHDDPACGDGWALSLGEGVTSAMVVDGLGHGPLASDAAKAGIDAWLEMGSRDPAEAMADVSSAMQGTRGGAVALARYDVASDALRFAGIGNIAASLQAIDTSRGLASHPGIVGVQFRRTQAFEFPQAAGRVLVMHSDGIQSRWNLRDYPGIVTRHPGVIATMLHRDFARGRDDATVLVIRLENGV